MSRIVVEEMNEDGRGRIQAAAERIGGGGEPEIEHALVLRGVRVSLLHDVVAPGEVAVELAAGAGSAGDDEPAVPVVREPEEEARLAARIVGHARVELDAGDLARDRGPVGRIGGDDAAVRLGRESG